MGTSYVGGGGEIVRYRGGGEGEDEDEDEQVGAKDRGDEDRLCTCFWYSSRRCWWSRFFDRNTFSQ